jgi:hypothetical protein
LDDPIGTMGPFLTRWKSFDLGTLAGVPFGRNQ